MAKSIFITGIAGSGKTSISAELTKRGYKAYNIEEVEGLFVMLDRRTGKPFIEYDDCDMEKVKYHDWACNKNKLQELIRKNKNSITFYCGIASNTEEILPLFYKTILLEANSEVIRKRLAERTNNDFGKSPEVQDWVLGRRSYFENYMKAKGAIVIDADRSLAEVADEIIEKTK